MKRPIPHHALWRFLSLAGPGNGWPLPMLVLAGILSVSLLASALTAGIATATLDAVIHRTEDEMLDADLVALRALLRSALQAPEIQVSDYSRSPVLRQALAHGGIQLDHALEFMHSLTIMGRQHQLALVDPQGRTVLATRVAPLHDYGKSAGVRRLLAGESAVHMGIITDQGQHYWHLVVPVTGTDAPEGALATAIPVGSLPTLQDFARDMRQGQLQILRKGELITTFGAPVSVPAMRGLLLEDLGVELRYLIDDSAHQSARILTLVLVAGGCFAVTLALAVLSLFAAKRLLVRPLEDCRRYATALLDEGGARRPPPTYMVREIRFLADHFATVAARALRRRQELVTLNQSLEQRVAERTLELERANRDLEELSRTDALTALANRRHFDEYLDRVWRHACTSRGLVSLILIDIDDFKTYNDTYGHQAGDACLRQVADVILDLSRRPLDLAARYGGEELALVLPETDLDGALHLAARVLESIRALKLPHRGSSIGGILTVSAGVACLPAAVGTPATKLVEYADGALYQAKQQGRDRVCAAPGSAGEEQDGLRLGA